MNAAFFDDTEVAAACGVIAHAASGEIGPGKHVGVAEFRELAVSHRRMVRVDQPNTGLKGLRDVDTGETFFTNAHRLAAK
ncbi:MAG: hypothetical protein IAF94_11675 [Pirellulaceae bacterium]|nr:hypothetical protein [Pirellulaceae bacterium]